MRPPVVLVCQHTSSYRLGPASAAVANKKAQPAVKTSLRVYVGALAFRKPHHRREASVALAASYPAPSVLKTAMDASQIHRRGAWRHWTIPGAAGAEAICSLSVWLKLAL